MMGQPVQARLASPHMQRQQQIIQQHIQGLTIEQRQEFSAMNPQAKHQYLAQRNLLLRNPNPGGVQLQRHTIQLTEQQRQLLQSLDPQQRAIYIQKLQREREAQLRAQQQQLMQRQQVLAQQQQQQGQQQMQAMSPQQGQAMSPGMVGGQGTGQPQQQSPGWAGGQVPGPSPTQFTPGSSPGAGPVSPLHPSMSPHVSPGQLQGHVSPNRMGAPAQVQPGQVISPGLRQAWSGDPHPALAQVPRTPQQIQHLQRLQMQQRQGEQVPGVPQGEHMVPPGQTQQPGQGVMLTQQQQQQRMLVQQQASQQPNTKAALQTMIQARLGPGGQPLPPTPDGSAASRLQMMNQQLQAGGGVPVQQQMLQQQQQQMLAMQQQRQGVMGQPGNPGAIMGVPPQAGPPRFAGPRVGPGVGPRVGIPGMQQQRMPQFVGHSVETRLPPDLCLLGCIFVIVDYQDQEESKHLDQWRKVITQYGGEIEEALSARVTHVLCSSQKSALCQQAKIEGKRLITGYWLNDTVLRKKVLPPWKAVHFPLPSSFEPPCANMILTITGFKDRDRDYVKDMIKMAGGTYTGSFSSHNHAILCARPEGEKFEKAREWRVPAVSCQWINDVLFGSMNAAQSMNNPRYQQFKPDEPLRIDYSLVPHLIAAWKIPIRVTPETYAKFKANPPTRIKRKAEKQRQEREAEERRRKENEERMAQGLPPLEAEAPAQAPPQTQPKVEQDQSQSNQCQEPMDTKPPVLNSNENIIPKPEAGVPSTSGIIPDQPQEMEVDPVTGQPVPKKPKLDEVKEEKMDVDDGNKENENQENKPPQPVIIFSGLDSSTRKELEPIVLRLGGQLTEVPKEATHLVMTKLMRTDKFCQCVPRIKFMVQDSWVRRSGEEGKWLQESNYPLNNPIVENKYGFNLDKTLACGNRDKLFNGKVFYITPSVVPRMKVLTDIIEAAGGKVDLRRMKTPNQIKEINAGGKTNYIVITCEEDVYLVTEVLRAGFGIFSPEFVLSAVTKCEMDFDLRLYITT